MSDKDTSNYKGKKSYFQNEKQILRSTRLTQYHADLAFQISVNCTRKELNEFTKYPIRANSISEGVRVALDYYLANNNILPTPENLPNRRLIPEEYMRVIYKPNDLARCSIGLCNSHSELAVSICYDEAYKRLIKDNAVLYIFRNRTEGIRIALDFYKQNIKLEKCNVSNAFIHKKVTTTK